MERDIQQIMTEQQQKINDEDLAELKKTVDSKVTQFKLLLNQKSALFEEMYQKALIMINRDK